MLAAAGVEDRVRFHDLRHTFTTLAVQSGADVKTIASMLGHCSAAFTLDTYTHVTDSMQRRAADKISVFLNANVQINTNMQVNVNIVGFIHAAGVCYLNCTITSYRRSMALTIGS